MSGFLIRRTLQALVVVIGVTIITFLLLHLLPGGPARAILGPRATPVQIKAFVQQYGLDKPLVIQYVTWLGQLLHGNLGFSYKLNQSVDSLLAQRLPKTLILTGIATLVALIVAIPLGVLQAVRRNRPVDYALTGLSFIFYATPTFFLGIILVLVFAVLIHALPAEAPQGTSALGVLSQPAALVLPVATLALTTIAAFSRYMRSSTLDALLQDYVRTARAKGLSERTVLFVHVLRNALIPIATLLGLSLPGILSGSLITESVFNYPGMGLLFWNAAQTSDFPILLGVTVIVGVATVLGSLLADITYAVLDPRVRYVH
ncbi:MAG: ABC transporter permease [Actinomycetes bacterium]